jgi:aminoglycoside 6-adenylyltransferase
MFQKFVDWAQARPDVRAVLLTSSLTNPSAPVDAFSDYDVIFVVQELLPYWSDRDWLEDFGRVLVLYRDPIQPEPDYHAERAVLVVQYEDGLKIDFSLWPVELMRQVAGAAKLPDNLDVGYRVLLDKDGLTAGLKPPTYRAHIPAPPSEADYLETIEEFFHEATYAAKHLRRGDLVAAKYNLDVAMKFDLLRKMLEWRAEIERGWSVKPGAYGRGLHRLIAPEAWAAFARTYVGAGVEENWQALFETVDLFYKSAREVGDQLGFSYPQELHRRAVRYLQRVRDREIYPDGP